LSGAGHYDLPECDPTVIRRDALMPERSETSIAEPRNGLFSQEHVLKAAAGKNDLRLL
jgi:hypothetical protein